MRLRPDGKLEIDGSAEDGGMPTESVRERCRPDVMARLAILSSAPPMTVAEPTAKTMSKPDAKPKLRPRSSRRRLA